MTQVRFFTDEDIYAGTVAALRNAGFDALSTPEAGRRGESDESQLAWAQSEGRAFITFDVAHFARLHAEWLQQRRDHAGIIVSSQRPIGDLIRRMVHLGNTLDSETMRNRLEFLSDW